MPMITHPPGGPVPHSVTQREVVPFSRAMALGFIFLAASATSVAAFSRAEGESQIPDKSKYCSLELGCPDIGSQVCAEFQEEVDTPFGSMVATIFCYRAE